MKKFLSFIISGMVIIGSIFCIPAVNVTLALDQKPTAICMTFYDDIYSRGFAWQTSTSVTETKLLLVNSEDVENTIDWNKAQVINGEEVKDFEGYRYHKVKVQNLQPGAKYYYKVGGNGVYSDEGSFIVEEENAQDVSFIYVTDSQETSMEGFKQWEKTLKTATQTIDADFITFLGDLVDNSHADWGSDYSKIKMEEWSYAYDVPQEILMNIPLMSVVGNHESAGYTFVDHNYIDYAGTSTSGGYYSFDYADVHFVGLNGNESHSESVFNTQLQWLKDDLANTDKKWKVVMIHQGVYSTGDHSNDSDCLYLRSVLPQVMADYEVDLVLQGHDHVYTRTLPYYYGEGENGKIPNRNVMLVPEERDGETLYYSMEPDGTYYVTINYSGTKSYPPVEYDTGRIFPGTSLINGKQMSQQVRERMFATVEVEGDELVFKSYLALEDGSSELYDYFAIKKNTYKEALNIIDALPESSEIDARSAMQLYNAKNQVESLSDRALKRLGEERVEKLNNVLSVINVNDAVKAYDVIVQIDKLLENDNYDVNFWANYSTAKNNYYNLTNAQMEMVVNRDALLNLDQTIIESFAVKEVQQLVDNIKSAKNKNEAIIIAREAYNLLSENAKSQIKNTELLNSTTSGCGSAIFGGEGVIFLLSVALVTCLIFRRKYEEK